MNENAPLPTEVRAVLKKLLTVVTRRAAALLEILDREQAVLLELQPLNLPEVTRQKGEALGQLETADRVLRDYLRRLPEVDEASRRDGSSEPKMRELLAQCPECIERWKELSATLVALRDANQRNGAILNKNQQRTTRIISIITGREPLPEYTRQGGMPLETVCRSLAKA